MATSSNSTGPYVPLKSGGVLLPPTPQKIQATLDLAISLLLHRWTALTLTIQNSWGGPDGPAKRDWLAAEVSSLLRTTPKNEMDRDYLEEFLIQAVEDNFDVLVDDGSGGEIAQDILRLRGQVEAGKFEEVQAMWERWRERAGKGEKIRIHKALAEGEDEEDDDDDDDESEEFEDEEGDVDMEEAPELVKREKVLPKVDEEGFTEVVGKRRR